MNEELGAQSTEVKVNSRLLSLDVFRGVTVAAMILVNNPGDWGHIYAPLEHSDWNGCTPADLIFPFFLFIVGVSIVFAMEGRKADNDPAARRKLAWGVIRRGLTLVFLGELFSGFPFYHFGAMRIPGVLFRIGLVFGITGLIYIKTTRKTQLILFWLFIIAYYLMMTLIPVPGIGYANLQPETNLGAWIDRSLFGTAHLWIDSVTWDPEGLLGTLPAVSTCLFGVLTGTWLKRKDTDAATKVAWMFSVGLMATVGGLIWDLFFPINKALWTSSYVLYTGGLASIGLAFFYWMIDVQGYKKFTRPFVVYGVNAITVYFLSSVIARSMNMIKVGLNGKTVSAKDYLVQVFYKPYFSPVNASLAGGLTFVLIWLLVLWLMHKRNIIIKV